MWLQIHSIRFPQVYCELLWTNDQRFFYKSALLKFFTFFKIMLESCGYSLYTSFVYSLVDKDGTKVEDIEGDDAKE